MFNPFFRSYVPGFRVRPQDDVPSFNLDDNGLPRRANTSFDDTLPDSAAQQYPDAAQTQTPPSISFTVPGAEGWVLSYPPIGSPGFGVSPQDDVPGFNVGPRDDVPGFKLDENGGQQQETTWSGGLPPGSVTPQDPNTAQIPTLPPSVDDQAPPAPPPLPRWPYQLGTMLPPLFPTTFDPRIWPHIEINSPPSIGPATAPGATPRLPSIAPQPPPGIDIRSSAATTQNPNLQPAAQQAMRNARLQPLPVGLPYAQANGGKLQDPWSVPIARQAPGVPPTLSVRPVAASNFILANAGDDAMRLQRQRPPLQDQETQRRNQATRPSIAGRPPVLRPKAQGFSQLIEAYRRRLSEVEGRQSITDQSLPHLPLNENVVPSYASADGGPSVIASFDYARSLAKTAYQAYGSNTEGNKSTRPSISDAYPEPLIPGAQYAQVVGQRNDAVLNNPRIDRTTERLLSILAETVQSLGSGAGPIFGIQAHFEFANRVKELNIPGIREEGVEQSFSLGEAARYGLAGSVRTDVVLRDRFGIPIAVYDLKTGNAKLSPSRVREIRDAVGVPNIPVIELRYRSESSLLR